MSKKRKHEPTEREAWEARRRWVSKNRWYIGGAGLLTAGWILWPRTTTASVQPPATTPPPVNTAALDQVARQQAQQQVRLGETIGLAAAGVVVAYVIYAGTSDAPAYRPATAHVPSYRFIAPSAPTRSVWSSWVADW